MSGIRGVSGIRYFTIPNKNKQALNLKKYLCEKNKASKQLNETNKFTYMNSQKIYNFLLKKKMTWLFSF